MNIEELKIKAKKGNLKAIRELGKIYYYGDHKKGTPAQGIKPKDPKKINQEEGETAAKTAKTANFDKKLSQIKQYCTMRIRK